MTVAVEDAYGNTVTTNTSTVTLTLSSGTFAGGSSTASAPAVNGVATFSNLVINAAGSYTLTASDGTLTGATSSAFTITGATSFNLDFNADWARFGQVLPTGVSALPRALSDQLLKIKLRGSLSAPRLEKEIVPGVIEPVKRVFAGNGV